MPLAPVPVAVASGPRISASNQTASLESVVQKAALTFSRAQRFAPDRVAVRPRTV